MKSRLLISAVILAASSGLALAQASGGTANPTSDGQATSATRTVHSKHHKKASDASQQLPPSNAKAARPQGSGPTSGR